MIHRRWELLDRCYGWGEPEQIVALERTTVEVVATAMGKAGFPSLHRAGLSLEGDVQTYLSRCLRALRPKRKATMFTPPQVAERYGVSPDTVRRWIVEGTLKAVSVGKGTRPRYRISETALREFDALRATRVAPKQQRRRKRKPDLLVRRYS